MIASVNSNGVNFRGMGKVEANAPTHDRKKIQDALDKALENLKNNSKLDKIPLILIVVPFKDADLYSHIKWWGDVKIGIPTVCVQKDILQPKDRKRSVDPKTLGNLR